MADPRGHQGSVPPSWSKSANIWCIVWYPGKVADTEIFCCRDHSKTISHCFKNLPPRKSKLRSENFYIIGSIVKKNFHSYFQGLYYDDEDLYGSDDSDTETRMKEPPRRNKSVTQEKVNDVMVDTFN